MSKKFILGSYDIEFSDGFINYNELRKEFSDLSVEGYDEFIKLYKSNCLNIDDVHNEAFGLGCQCISKNVDRAVSILISKDLMHIDKNNFINKYYTKFLIWEDDFENVDSRYREIVLTAEQEKAYRDERKDYRGRWQGGGFGLGGAIGGAMQAGAMNMATGAAHSVFNIAGNMITSVSVSSKKDKLFANQSTMEDLALGVMENIFAIHYAIIDALRENGNNTINQYVTDSNEEMSKSLLNNLKTGHIPKEKEEEIIKNIIHNNPYNEEVYLFLLKKYGDKNHGIDEITAFLHINIDNEKNNIVEEYYSSLSKDTEEETLESLEEFKEFADNMNLEDISKYLNDFETILEKHDINIRTVDSILFETREEAALAGEEFNEIISVRNGVVLNSEKSIKAAIDAIEDKEYKTIIKNRHLSELNNELLAAIRFEDQLFLNDNYSISSITAEDDADRVINELNDLVLRSMDLVKKRIVEVEEKRAFIIEEADREFVEAYFKSVVILNEADVEREVNNIRNLDIRTGRVKDEKANYVLLRAEKLIKKHNALLEKAIKYEIRMTSVKVEKKTEKKGVFGFISKAIEKGANLIDEIQEKSEKEAWDFITSCGDRSLDSIRNR